MLINGSCTAPSAAAGYRCIVIDVRRRDEGQVGRCGGPAAPYIHRLEYNTYVVAIIGSSRDGTGAGRVTWWLGHMTTRCALSLPRACVMNGVASHRSSVNSEASHEACNLRRGLRVAVTVEVWRFIAAILRSWSCTVLISLIWLAFWHFSRRFIVFFFCFYSSTLC